MDDGLFWVYGALIVGPMLLGWAAGVYLLYRIAVPDPGRRSVTLWMMVWALGVVVFGVGWLAWDLVVRVPADRFTSAALWIEGVNQYGGPLCWMVAWGMRRRERRLYAEGLPPPAAPSEESVWPPPPTR